MEGNIIPVIDLEEIEGKSEMLREVCEKWGSFRVVNYGVPTKLMAELKSVARHLLDLSKEIKLGNVEVGTCHLLKCTLCMKLLQSLTVLLLTLFLHFAICSNFPPREILESYGEAIHKTAIDIANKVTASMGVKGYSFGEWCCHFRVNKYTFNPENIGSLVMERHTDSGFLTILQDDEYFGGLEVKNESGAFVAVDPYPGALMVNLGDMAVPWSNGILPSVEHQVRCKGAGFRYSIAIVFFPPVDNIIEAPSEFIDDEHPRLYGGVTYKELRSLRSSTKLFCGQVPQLLRLGE